MDPRLEQSGLFSCRLPESGVSGLCGSMKLVAIGNQKWLRHTSIFRSVIDIP